MVGFVIFLFDGDFDKILYFCELGIGLRDGEHIRLIRAWYNR